MIVLMTSLPDGLSAVVFDFFGTLTPGTPQEVWLEHATQVAAVIGVDGHAFQQILHDTFPDRATGVLGDLAQIMQSLAAMAGVRITGEQLANACQVRRQCQRRLFTLREDALPTIAWLRERGLKIGVLSDCSIELPESWPELPLSAVVDAAVFSCIAGFRKPDPRLFELLTASLGVDPQDCLYVGDGGGQELTGARAVGMKAVLLAAEDWSANAVYDREEGWDGDRITSLAELCG